MPKTLPVMTIPASALSAFSASAQDETATSATATQDNDTQAAQGNYQPNQEVGSGNWFIDASAGRTHGSNVQHFGSLSGFDFAHGQRGRRTGYGLEGSCRWKAVHR